MAPSTIKTNGLLMVWEGPRTPKKENHNIYALLGTIQAFHDFQLLDLKVREFRDFPLCGVRGPSKTINKPVVLKPWEPWGQTGPHFAQIL